VVLLTHHARIVYLSFSPNIGVLCVFTLLMVRICFGFTLVFLLSSGLLRWSGLNAFTLEVSVGEGEYLVLVPFWDEARVKVLQPYFPVDYGVDCSFMKPTIPLTWDPIAHFPNSKYTKYKYWAWLMVFSSLTKPPMVKSLVMGRSDFVN